MISYIGKKFGQLTVIKQYILNGRLVGDIVCECGNKKTVRIGHLKSGATKSCGCYNMKVIINRLTKHGLYKHPLYSLWQGIRRRCNDQKGRNYNSYGAIGVKVCEEWENDFMSFYNWALSKGWQKGLEIDKDIKGNGKLYSPDTCCCVTHLENSRHRKCSLRYDYNGKNLSLKEISEQIGISYGTLNSRVQRKYTKEDLFAPVWRKDNNLHLETL